MKLSALFARYLYQHKRLNLPGIGVFFIDPAVAIPDASEKNFSDFFSQIRYEQKNVVSADEELINFIRTETGKIKPLAESDLDSFLSDGKILLNIGKPFHIEGIGSLIKTRSGAFEFTPGNHPVARLEGFYNEPVPDDVIKRKTAFADEHAENSGGRKWMIAAAVIVGLILIVWGGYSLYNRNAPATSETAVQHEPPPAVVDTPKASVLLDSVKKIIDSSKASMQSQSDAAGTYKFIIERTASKERALKRYQQLVNAKTDIKMQTNDSTMFALYFSIQSTPADTARIRDSLKTWYGRREVFVEP